MQSDREKRLLVKLFISFLLFLIIFLPFSANSFACTITSYSLPSSFSRTDIGIAVSGQSSTKLYGSSYTNGHYMTSVDGVTWVDRTYSPSVYTPLAIQFVFDESNNYMYAVTSNGKLYRATIDVFNNWTDVSPPNPGTTTGRPDIFALNGTYLFYGNYNSNSIDKAHIYRSSDNGVNWTEVLSETNGKHVHSVYVDPTNSANIFANIGDVNDSSKGLWYSASNGNLGSWVHLSSNRYAIDMELQNSGGYKRLLMEGDGASQPPIFGYNYSQIGTPSNTDVVINTPAGVGASWVGTTRGIKLLNSGNLFFITTAEGGAVPGATRDGLWLARGSGFSDVTLLEEITGNTWSYLKTYEFNGYVFNLRYRMTIPSYVSSITTPDTCGTASTGPEYIGNAPLPVSVAEKSRVISMASADTFKYDAYLSVEETPKVGAFRIPDTNYWQAGSIYEVWWKNWFNGARILSSEILKSFTLIFKYNESALEKSLPKANLKLAYSSDKQNWTIIPISFNNLITNEIYLVTKQGGYYMLVGNSSEKSILTQSPVPAKNPVQKTTVPRSDLFSKLLKYLKQVFTKP